MKTKPNKKRFTGGIYRDRGNNMALFTKKNKKLVRITDINIDLLPKYETSGDGYVLKHANLPHDPQFLFEETDLGDGCKRYTCLGPASCLDLIKW